MSARAIIRPAVPADQGSIERQRLTALQDMLSGTEAKSRLRSWLRTQHEENLPTRIEDHCLLTAWTSARLVGSVELDLDQATIGGLCVLAQWRGLGIGTRLLEEAERLAVRFGMRSVGVHVPGSAAPFFERARYARGGGRIIPDYHGAGFDAIPMRRDLTRRQTRYGRKISDLLDKLGIPASYGRRHRLMLQPECTELATIGSDAFGREQHLRPDAAMAWYGMRNAAATEGIDLQVVSAFRSVDYQAEIIRRKRRRKQRMKHILRVSAAPGYSEHHTGRALDLNRAGVPPLEEHFERTDAFEWLVARAGEHGFRLSYPRGNRHSLAYEPWHWAWVG